MSNSNDLKAVKPEIQIDQQEQEQDKLKRFIEIVSVGVYSYLKKTGLLKEKGEIKNELHERESST